MRPVARIAQSVEQGIENPRVRGSIPRPGTIHRSTLVRSEISNGCLNEGGVQATLAACVDAPSKIECIKPSRKGTS